MLQRFVKTFGGDPNKKEIEKISRIVTLINGLENTYEKLSDEELRLKTGVFKSQIAAALEGITEDSGRQQAEQDILINILPDAFAAVREASKRTLGQRHYDVQLIGGMILHQGKIAEMRTGEGKTLVATLPLYLNALTGKGVHLVTVNDYLARRDARWMGEIFNFLGLSVGILQMASSTENGKKAFLYDPSREHTREDQHKMRLVDRSEAYRADLTYGTNSEFGFDYLRDNMTMRLDDRVQRGHYFVIVDEVDNVLIDEARTPLIISGPASGDVEWYGRMASLVRQLREEDFEVSEKERSVTLSEIGTAHVEQILGQPLRDPDRPEDVTPEQARLIGFLEQALRAQHLFRRNKDYLVQAGKVVIVDEFTGRLMPGRRWSDGLHQAVEAKEGVKVEPENVTYATITLQNYFRMYQKLAGMTGTALTEAEEFFKIYKLSVLPIPTNLEYQSLGPTGELVEVKARDEEGYEYSCFSYQADPEKKVVFWRRKDYPDVIFRTLEAKLRALVREIIRLNIIGRPQLVGTTSVESSERLSSRLRAEPVRRLMQVLLIRHVWMLANGRIEDGRAIPALELMNKPIEGLRPEDLRPMAKELNISLNPEEPANLLRLLSILQLKDEDESRLLSVLQGGVSHSVLNARKHTEESQIIAGAGAFGAVTIATNMAGRGVDIKLGGELAEEVLGSVNRVLRKAGFPDPYDMTQQERRVSLQKLDPYLFGIYDAEVKHFLQFFEEMELVRALGGLHVVGSERHEARRIDNQLRGRAARQGDPGSSRFYLSLEDDLMRMFGGEQVKNIMARLNIDDDFPLQARMVSNMIEGSQTRVEGANFDVRKHLIEYDDVLNSQRMRIYSQRNRVFEKDDLTEDLDELLRAEVDHRVAAAIESDEFWRLLAWLDQIQPPFQVGGKIFPSYTYRLIINHLSNKTSPIKNSFHELAENVLDISQEHFINWALEQIDRAGDSIKAQISEKTEALDNFLDTLADHEESDERRPQELVEELNNTVRIQFRLSNEEISRLKTDPKGLFSSCSEQIQSTVHTYSISRLMAVIEFRLGEPLGLNNTAVHGVNWKAISADIEARLVSSVKERRERLLGNNGQIIRDLEILLERFPNGDEQALFHVLSGIAQGTRTSFDTKTHRQVRQVFLRLQYGYYGGELLRKRSSENLAADILDHLNQARSALLLAYQESEAVRLNQPAGSEQIVVLGKQIQNQISRQVLLGAITELWVEYLTHVEALRVSIGLEAYAQRDPLVQYKGKASALFQSLLTDIRAAVVSRIFLYRPKAAMLRQESDAPLKENGTVSPPERNPIVEARSEKKRKRHRH